jgi:hypothetical protein
LPDSLRISSLGPEPSQPGQPALVQQDPPDTVEALFQAIHSAGVELPVQVKATNRREGPVASGTVRLPATRLDAFVITGHATSCLLTIKT